MSPALFIIITYSWAGVLQVHFVFCLTASENWQLIFKLHFWNDSGMIAGHKRELSWTNLSSWADNTNVSVTKRKIVIRNVWNRSMSEEVEVQSIILIWYSTDTQWLLKHITLLYKNIKYFLI